MDKPIDWQDLANRLGTLGSSGESGGDNVARQAIELLIGTQRIRDSVDHYVTDGRGRGLARSVLALVRPCSAMERCYEIYRTDQDDESKRSAIELLRVIADERVLPWVAEFLENVDEAIQVWGIGVMDQLLWSEVVRVEDCEDLLLKAEGHSNPEVRGVAQSIRAYLKERVE